MTLQFHAPFPPLGQLVEQFTYYKGYRPGHAIDRFLPDGNVELVIDLTDFPKPVYDNQTLEEKEYFQKAWISGLRREYLSIHSGLDAEMFVIRFRKGGAYPIVGMPLTELADRVVEGQLVFGRAILHLREALLQAPSPAEKFQVATQHLLRMAAGQLLPDPCVAFAAARLVQQPGQVSLEALSRQVGYSQKHFIHLFKTQVGMTPKAFMRILRFQRAIAEIEKAGDIRWAQLALECGYYDQAHFNRDFRAFSGFSPEEYLKRKSGILNYVPVG